MYRRNVPLMVLLLMFSLVLSACGASTANSTITEGIPNYPGAKTATINPDAKAQFENLLVQQGKDPKVETYATGDTVAKVKEFFTAEFKKQDWMNLADQFAATSSTVQQLEANGGGLISMLKGNKTVAIYIIPNSTMKSPGLGANDVLYIVGSVTVNQ